NGLLRASASQSGKTDGGNWLLAASNQQWAGQRQQSASRSATAVSRLRMQLAERSELTLTLLGHNGPQARDPGGLTAEDAEDDPTQAAAINRRFRTGEQVRQGQGGLRYRYRGERWYSEASAFGWARQFRARVPFRAVELERWVGGGRFVIGYDHGALRLETGIESELQRDRRRNYGNDDGVVTDELRLRQDENLTTTAWLSQAEWRSPARTLRVRGAARIDRFSYALTDRLLEDGDGSGVRDFTVGTALLGAVWRPTSDLDLFGNYSVSYDVPTLGELAQSTTSGAQPVSGLARDLGPTQIQSVEFGARGGWEPLRYEGTVFYARSDDEIISRELSPGLSVFQNAGVSERAGVEAQGALRWREFDVILQGSYLWTALKNDELITGFGLDDRERIPGAPEWLTYGQLRYRAGNGLFAAYELRGRGEVSVGPQLSEIAWVSHARAGFTLPITEGDLTLSFGVRNLTDARYSDNFRPNAAGARFFEPAPGRWVYFNLAISAGEHN
ncbi:MAG: TonB-dependent receptor, partial [Myxococcota bacterium]